MSVVLVFIQYQMFAAKRIMIFLTAKQKPLHVNLALSIRYRVRAYINESARNVVPHLKMIKAFVTREHAVNLAVEIFDLHVDVSSKSAVKELGSYFDRNFYIRARKGEVEREFVLKVSNSDDTEYEGLLDELNAMMLHLTKRGITCPVPQPSSTGKLVELRQFTATPDSLSVKRAKKEKGEEAVLHNHALRLFTFIPGKTMREVPCSTDLCFKVGYFAAEVDKVLKACGFNKDLKSPVLENRYYPWDFYNFHEAKAVSGVIKDPQQKQLLRNIEKSFETFVQPELDNLPKQCIHGDINDANLIIQNIPGSTKFEVCGLLDFGDARHSCRVFDVSIAAAYMMTLLLDDPVAAGTHTLAGYEQKNPLTQLERNLVFYLIQARLYQSICFGTNTSELYPENAEYLLYSAKRAWKVLDKLAAISKKEFDQKWTELCTPNYTD